MYLSERHRIFRLSSKVITALAVFALGLTIISPSIQALKQIDPSGEYVSKRK